MHTIEWSDRFSTGNTAVDHEHREIIELLNTLFRAINNHEPEDVVTNLLGEVNAQISAHFALEEILMTQVGYDRLLEHKMEHENLMDQIRDLMDEYDSGAVQKDIDAFEQRLEVWFINHFKTADARLHDVLPQD